MRGWILVPLAFAVIFLAGPVLERLYKADWIGQRAFLWGFIGTSVGALASFLVAIRIYDVHLG